jgi:hypothetical protein
MERRLGAYLGALVILCALGLPPAWAGTPFSFVNSSTLDSGGDDAGYALGVDAAGNVYAAGFTNATGVRDIWVGKYNPTLTLISSATFDHTGAGHYKGFGLAVHPDGDIYVTGKVQTGANGSGSSNHELWVGRYDSSLAFISSATIPTSGSDGTAGTAMRVGPDGNIYVTGAASNATKDVWLGKFNPSLVLVSSASYDNHGGGNGGDKGNGLAFDNGGNIYVAGKVKDALSLGDIWLGKFSPSLVLVSSAAFNDGSADSGFGVCVDPEGIVYEVGVLNFKFSGNQIMWLGKYNSSLVLLSSETMPGLTYFGSETQAAGIACDASNLYVSMSSASAGVNSILVAQFDPTLILTSSMTITVGANASANSLALDGHGSLFASGLVTNATEDIWLGKFSAPLSQASGVIGPGGGGLSFNAGALSVTLNVPPGAFSAPETITISAPVYIPGTASGAATLSPTGLGFEVALIPPVQPAVEVPFQVVYQAPFMPAGIDESKLIMARYDDPNRLWVPLVTTGSALSHSLASRTNHFSSFQMMQATASSSVGAVHVFPNPFRPAQGNTSVTISNLPVGANIKIYTLMGTLIKELNADGNGMASWDATNTAGVKVASGVYFGYATYPDQGHTFKILVER